MNEQIQIPVNRNKYEPTKSESSVDEQKRDGECEHWNNNVEL